MQKGIKAYYAQVGSLLNYPDGIIEEDSLLYITEEDSNNVIIEED